MRAARLLTAGALFSAWWFAAGCGVVGPPIAPEDVGVTPIIEKQKKAKGQQTGQERGAAEAPVLQVPKGQDEELPPLRPVGTR